jgi:glycine/D-amino acid oxidase-like deaminating enzyme
MAVGRFERSPGQAAGFSTGHRRNARARGGYGIQTAPAMARTAAALATLDPLPSDVASEGLSADDVSPRRFAEIAARGLSLPHG